MFISDETNQKLIRMYITSVTWEAWLKEMFVEEDDYIIAVYQMRRQNRGPGSRV